MLEFVLKKTVIPSYLLLFSGLTMTDMMTEMKTMTE